LHPINPENNPLKNPYKIPINPENNPLKNPYKIPNNFTPSHPPIPGPGLCNPRPLGTSTPWPAAA